MACSRSGTADSKVVSKSEISSGNGGHVHQRSVEIADERAPLPLRGSVSGTLDPSPDAVRALPVDFVQRVRVLPLALHNGSIRIATASPLDERVTEDIRLLTGLEVEEVSAPESEILERIAQSYQITVEKLIENLNPEKAAAIEGRTLHDIEVMANEPTVVNLVNVIISEALRDRASDIHLVPFEETLQLRYRVDGLLQEKQPPPKQLHQALISRLKIMADMNIAERYMPQDGHIQINHRGARVDIRVGTLPTIYGESIVLRLLEKNTKLLTAEELGLDPERAALRPGWWRSLTGCSLLRARRAAERRRLSILSCKASTRRKRKSSRLKIQSVPVARSRSDSCAAGP